MNWYDIALIVILFFFTWKGFRTGLVGAIGGFFGIIFGIWAGSHYMQAVGQWIMTVANFDNEYLASILGFIGIFMAVNVAVGIIVSVINRVFHIIPFIDLFNKLMGAVIGLIGGVVAIAALVYLMSLLPISETVSEALVNSQMANWAVNIAVIIKPFMPQKAGEIIAILTASKIKKPEQPLFARREQ